MSSTRVEENKSDDQSKKLIDEIVFQIKSSKLESVDELKKALENAKKCNIVLSEVRLKSDYSDPLSLMYVHYQHDDIYTGWDKQKLLHEFGASQYKSSWGRSYERTLIWNRIEIRDKDYCGNEDRDRRSCEDSGISEFIQLWDNASKAEKKLMCEDSMLFSMTLDVFDTYLALNAHKGMELLSCLSDFPEMQSYRESRMAIAKSRQIRNSIQCAVSGNYNGCIQDLERSLTEAKENNIAIHNMKGISDETLPEGLIRYGKNYVAEKIKLLRQAGFAIRGNRERHNFEPLAFIAQKKQKDDFESLLPMLDVNEETLSNETILFSFVEKLSDCMRGSKFHIKCHGQDSFDKTYQYFMRIIELIINSRGINVTNKQGVSVLKLFFSAAEFSPTPEIRQAIIAIALTMNGLSEEEKQKINDAAKIPLQDEQKQDSVPRASQPSVHSQSFLATKSNNEEPRNPADQCRGPKKRLV